MKLSLDDIDDSDDRWDALGTLLGGYLNQDYGEMGTVPEVVVEFCRTNESSTIEEAIHQIETLLENFPLDEESLSAACDRLGLGYHPPSDGFTYHDWLAGIAGILRENLLELRRLE